MTCWICKKEIGQSIRMFFAAKTRRERDGFRNVCDVCYTDQMIKRGYTFDTNRLMWVKN